MVGLVVRDRWAYLLVSGKKHIECRFVKINADDCDEFKEFCTSLRVREVPAFRFFRSGKEVKAAQLYLMPPGLNAAEQILRQEILANL